MSNDRHITHLLYPEGVSQDQRLLTSLKPESVPVDGRNLRDRLEAAYVLSRALRYINSDNIAAGDWRPFWSKMRDAHDALPSLHDIENLLAQTKNLDPHLALYIAFIRMFEDVQHDMNMLSKRHLDFFYEKVLRIQRKQSVADQVHVLFKPAKKTTSHRILEGTLLDAGIGPDGQALQYALARETILSQTKASDFRSVWIEKDRFGRSRLWSGIADTTEQQWSPFGEPQLSLPPEQRTMQDARIGFAIASPQLLLREGLRTIKIVIIGSPVTDTHATGSISGNALKASFTSSKGWSDLTSINSQLEWSTPDGSGVRTPTLTLDITLLPGDDSTEPYSEDVHAEGLHTAWPVLKVELDPEAYAYDGLVEFSPSETTIDVTVTGVSDVIVQNDLGLLDPNQPFLPFGPQPVLGANCYIGSAEIFRKPLQSCDIHVHWADLPASLDEHYELYSRSVQSTSFQANIELREGRLWGKVPLKFQDFLFKDELSANTTFSIVASEWKAAQRDASLSIESLDRFDSKTKDGFIRLRLVGPSFTGLTSSVGLPFKAFGHQMFSQLYARQAMALSQFLALPGTGTPPALPLQPYTPKIDSLSIDYASVLQESLGKRDGKVSLFSLDAFGHSPITAEADSLLPQYKGEGYCWIGLEDCELPQQISMLIDVADVPAPPEGLPGPEGYTWQILGEHGWKAFDSADILEEGTSGFRQRGIVNLNVLEDGVPAPRLPSDKIWIGIEAHASSASTLRWQGVYTQAALALLQQQDGRDLDEHLQGELAQETITKLVKNDVAVKGITQPYPSFGGQATEPDDAFYVRTSERLRHRQRGIQAWDYERLVLESFPGLYKAACLNHRSPEKAVAPGHLTIIVVPDWRNQPVVNPLMPTVDVIQRESMAAHLAQLVPPTVTVHVENPRYEQLLVDAQVALRPGFDPGYYIAELNLEIQKYLSPWAFSESQDIPFGGTVYKSEILALLENLPYVDYVAALKLYHIHDGVATDTISKMKVNQDLIVAITPEPTLPAMSISESFIVGRDVDTVTAVQAGAILVSHPSHRLKVLAADELSCPGTDTLGIGFMMVEVDFEVKAEF